MRRGRRPWAADKPCAAQQTLASAQVFGMRFVLSFPRIPVTRALRTGWLLPTLAVLIRVGPPCGIRAPRSQKTIYFAGYRSKKFRKWRADEGLRRKRKSCSAGARQSLH